MRIKKSVKKNGEIKNIKSEIGILHAMSKAFGQYFPGYSKYRQNPKAYMLIPKDGNYENMHYSNLIYVHKKTELEKGSKRALIKATLSLDLPNTTIQKLTGASESHIRKVTEEQVQAGKYKTELYEAWRAFKEKYGIAVELESFPIYTALIESEGKKSNLEIAKELRPEAVAKAKTNEEKRIRANKILRARRKLTDKGIIPRFNDHFEKQKPEIIKLLEEGGKTHQEIAELLNLKKDQVSNLARQLPKKKKKKEDEG